MRNTPYSFSKPQPTTPAPVQETSATKSGFVDLFSRVKKTEAPAQEPEPTQTETAAQSEIPNPKSEIPSSSSTTFEDGFNGFKETAGKKVSDFVENPEELAKMIVRFGNTARCIFLPNVYDRLMFTQGERDAIMGIVTKSEKNETENKSPDDGFNNFEKRVYARWKKLREAKETITYTEGEIVWLAKIIAKRIKDMTVAVWMEKYDWLIALLYLEFTHASAILAVKAEDFITSKFMGKAA